MNIDVRQIELAINGNERVAELLVEEGDRITKGQLLARLETERLEFSVERAKAIVATQQQVIARLEAGSRPEEIAKARADVEAANAVTTDTKRTYERQVRLRESNATPQQDVDDALAAHESAVAHAHAFQALLDLSVAGPRKEDKGEASRDLFARFDGSTNFRLVVTVMSDNQIAPLVDGRKALIVLHIGRTFSRDLHRDGRATVQVILDGRDSNTALITLGYAARSLTNSMPSGLLIADWLGNQLGNQ